MFITEKATHKADLPHRFEGQARVCTVCAGENLDARHKAWEVGKLAEREKADAGEETEVPREFG